MVVQEDAQRVKIVRPLPTPTSQTARGMIALMAPITSVTSATGDDATWSESCSLLLLLPLLLPFSGQAPLPPPLIAADGRTRSPASSHFPPTAEAREVARCGSAMEMPGFPVSM